jgi:hypothetical protein
LAPADSFAGDAGAAGDSPTLGGEVGDQAAAIIWQTWRQVETKLVANPKEVPLAMPSMTIAIPHSLTEEEAMGRIKNLLAEVKNDYGDKVTDLRENWTGNGGEFSFKAMGFTLSGTLAVKPNEVVMKGNFPLAALPFKSKIESMIRSRAEQLLAN